jgi:tetratricopeptide (TPR) repeat protein
MATLNNSRHLIGIQDPYRLLGVFKRSSPKEILRSFQKLYSQASTSHDGDHAMQLGRAFDILREPESRARVDLLIFNEPDKLFFCAQAKEAAPNTPCVVCGQTTPSCFLEKCHREWALTASEFIEVGDNRSAYSLLQGLRTGGNENAHVMHDLVLSGWWLAVDLLEAGQQDQAQQILREIREIDPENPYLTQNQAIVAEMTGDLDLAASSWTDYLLQLHLRTERQQDDPAHHARIHAAREHLADMVFWNPKCGTGASHILRETADRESADAAVVMALLAERRAEEALDVLETCGEILSPGVHLFLRGATLIGTDAVIDGLKIWKGMLKRFPRNGALRIDLINYSYLLAEEMRKAGDFKDALRVLAALATFVRGEPRVYGEIANTMKLSNDTDGYERFTKIKNRLEERRKRIRGERDDA